MSVATTNGLRPALLFVPDISGFTRFVQTNEIEHSRHIIEELLEKLIEANTIGLQVSEVEGDAILFYRFGPAPTAAEFFEQVEKMFVSFHAHLLLFATQRICQCGACMSMENLTLKIVAHFGDITQSHIKEHVKLFGEDVITVHRLLKNDIVHHEYALFTQPLGNQWLQAVMPEWAQREEGSREYDVGNISYGYVPLGPLRQFVPEPRAKDYSIPGLTVPGFSSEHDIQAPLNVVFGALTDLPARIHWMEGAIKVELLTDQLNRIGTKHRCIVDKHSPVMVTSGNTRTPDTITHSETDEKKTVCSVYTLRRQGEAATRLRIDGFVKDSLIPRVLFMVLARKKLANWFKASGENLRRYAEELYSKQQK